MNSEQEPKSLHVQHGHGCSIVWHEPVRADGCDNRRIKATCLRRLPLNGVAYWDIVVDLDGEKCVDMVLCRNSRTYAVQIARATINAIKCKACHARRNRKNRKARRDAEREAVIAETVARKNGKEWAMNDVMLEYEALKVLERSQSPVSTDALGNKVSFRLERHITKDEFGFMMCKLERLGLVSRSNTALMREVWAITDKGRQALKEEMGR